MTELMAWQPMSMRGCSTSSRMGRCTTRPSASLMSPAAWSRPPETFGLPLLGLPGSLLETEARNHGVTYFAEGFPDRRYRADGSLAPRSEPGAVLHEPREIEEQVVRLVRERRVATLCIHGDEPGAVAIAAARPPGIEAAGLAVRSFVDGSG